MGELLEERTEIGGFEGWADVEIMGHRVRTGELRNMLVGDRVFVQIREPSFVSKYEARSVAERIEIYSPTAIFAIRPLADEAEACEVLHERSDIPF